MTSDSNPSAINAAMLKVMKAIGPIAKEQRNKDQGFSFRGIDDVYDALHPILVKHGVICIPRVLELKTEEYTTSRGTVMHRTLVTVAHRFYADDGSFLEAITLGESADAGDKSASKAQSIAYKYAMFETFCIPTGEEDPDAANPEGPNRARATGKRVAGPRISRDQIQEIWKEATASAERLDVDRAKVMRVLLSHFEVTKTDQLAKAIFQDALALAREPDQMIADLPRDGGGTDE